MSTPPVAAGRSRAHPPYGWDGPTRTTRGKDSLNDPWPWTWAAPAGASTMPLAASLGDIVGHHVSGSSAGVRPASSASGVDSTSTVPADDLMTGGHRGSPERGTHQAALRGVPIRRP